LFGHKLIWFDFCYQYIYIFSQSSLRKLLRYFYYCYRYISVFSQSVVRTQTNLVRLLVSVYLLSSQLSLRKTTTLVRLLLSVYFFIQPNKPSETNNVGSTPANGVFLYLANQVFGHKISWFDYCYEYISVFSQSSLRTQTTLVRLLVSIYFFI
jgi:hypothetical protein